MSEQPDYLNRHFRRSRHLHWKDADHLAQLILEGDRVALARGITLVESEAEKDREIAAKLLEKCLPHSGNALRLGITGVPGAGKSTFIEAFGKHITGLGKKVAVLAIDPTSTLHHGSILGDKTRMNELAIDPNAFIRPSPSGGALGGVARKTREAISLCEAAGYDLILVETVGVGQSETEVHSMTDMFLLLLIAGGGDELQGIKRGIMEMADLVVINKEDLNPGLTAKSKQEYSSALHLFPPAASGWSPRVETCTALENKGIDKIWQQVESYRDHTTLNGYLLQKRKNQSLAWLDRAISEELRAEFYRQDSVRTLLTHLEAEVGEGKITPFAAARLLLTQFRKNDR